MHFKFFLWTGWNSQGSCYEIWQKPVVTYCLFTASKISKTVQSQMVSEVTLTAQAQLFTKTFNMAEFLWSHLATFAKLLITLSDMLIKKMWYHWFVSNTHLLQKMLCVHIWPRNFEISDVSFIKYWKFSVLTKTVHAVAASLCNLYGNLVFLSTIFWKQFQINCNLHF